MIELLFAIIDELSAESSVGASLNKLKQTQLFKQVKGIKGLLRSNPSSLLAKPLNQKLNRYIKNLTPAQLTQLNNLLSRVVQHSNYSEILQKKLGKQYNEFEKQIIKTNDKIKSDQKLELVKKSSALSSSWLVYGVFLPTADVRYDGLVGALNLTLKNGKSYTWYNVPYTVWQDMFNAKGSYGTGAGTAFWAGYLDKYISFGKTTATRLKRLANIERRQIRRGATIINGLGARQRSPRKQRRI